MGLDALGEKCAELKKEGKTIVHCHGVFDLLHPGHLKHFEAAKKFGDVQGHVDEGHDYDRFFHALHDAPSRDCESGALPADNVAAP